jgi:hypothetical protein
VQDNQAREKGTIQVASYFNMTAVHRLTRSILRFSNTDVKSKPNVKSAEEMSVPD